MSALAKSRVILAPLYTLTGRLKVLLRAAAVLIAGLASGGASSGSIGALANPAGLILLAGGATDVLLKSSLIWLSTCLRW